MTSVHLRAPAKVNLTLRILGRRPSGFHDLETVFQAVGLYDRLTVRAEPEPGVRLEVTGADVGPVEDNLVTRAARSFFDAGGIDAGVSIRLRKGIPAGAGLGGGSSDAGATLRALSALHPGRVAVGDIHRIASELGSDVLFFTGEAGRALGRGRGERLTPLEPLPEATLVLGLPRVHVATGGAYRALARARAAAGGTVPPALFTDLDAVPRTWEAAAFSAVNDFETVVPGLHPPVARALEALRAAAPRLALLSGSGAAVFGVFESPDDAERARARAAAACPEVPFRVAPTLARLPGLNDAPDPV